jgi:flagellar L-ring protein precursor FlgH
MRYLFSAFLSGVVLGTLMISGCATTPPTNAHQPMSVRPQPMLASAETTGSIYQPAMYAQSNSRYMPLFEDRRARNVGDTIIIRIEETLTASKSSNSSVSRKGSSTFSVPLVSGLPGKSFQGAGLGASSANDFEGKGDSDANNKFTGTIAVTVIETLPNGNLVVSGEKQLGINQGSEFIRFSGVVNPSSILSGNIVSSTQVANAQIEYRGNGQIDSAQVMGWLARFFMTFLPF